jgi:hypothetical protein
VTYGQHLRDRQLPNPGRPIWHNEKERDAAGEARQLVRLLGIKSGMTIADVGAGSGYYVERLSPIVGAHGRVPTQSSPLKGDASRTRPALNLIAQAIDQTCYWKKIESGSDGNHHQTGERHSPVIPTSHRFLPVRIRCHGATAPVLRRARAVPPPCWGLVFSRSQRARKGRHLSPASCQTGSVSEGAEGATPPPLPNNGPAT